MRFGETPGKIVGFASRAYEHADREITGHGCSEAVRVLKDGFVEVTRIGVQCRRLLGEGLHDGGMTVSYLGNVVVGVEKRAPRSIDEPYALATHDVNRVIVGEFQIRPEALPAPLDE